jgi:hypothetical protein
MQFELRTTGNRLIDAKHHIGPEVMKGRKDRFILQKNILKSNREFKAALPYQPSSGLQV